MSERRTLRWLRHLLIEYALDDEWRSTTALHAAVSNAGDEWYRVALVLERLAADGIAEIQVRGPVRRFRRSRVSERPVRRGPLYYRSADEERAT